ncbi:p-loop containing nucleoside triphosphate hydrolase-25 [Coleophoma crateriformis]|uniref:p-loop containing nucleoside triphosphate hydrolase-25 n=1 Tax=Coleophoma crateriformis TaxID=565419 RepID=A0A3D8RX33_9HELO|nr:p-loop containing nucleoside triphosphate hydrolase-25 [Coleophoma crateriformis]
MVAVDNNMPVPQEADAVALEESKVVIAHLMAKLGSATQQAAAGTADKETKETEETEEADETEETKDVTPAQAKQGMQCEVKNLYQKEDERGRCTWTEKYPDGLEEAAENEITARYAILVRNKKSFDSRKKLEIDSVVVQSPLLKEILGKVLKDYPGVSTNLNRLVFSAPFHAFVHRWEQFTTAKDAQEDGEAKEHLQLLYNVLHDELKDIIAARNDYTAKGIITFEHLWTIYQPGCTLFTSEWGRECAVKFIRGNYYEHNKYGPVFGMNTQVLDWDGDKFGFASSQSLVLAYTGTMAIADLDAFPLKFHPNENAIRAKLLKRGKLFEGFHGYHYKAYKAFALGKDFCGNTIKVTVDSRIIIDTYAFGKFNPNRLPHLAPLKSKSNNTPELSDETEDDETYESEYYDSDDDDSEGYGSDNDLDTGKTRKRMPLSHDQLIYASPRLKGYALKTKQWLEFFVDSVSDIQWNNEAFESLVLPADQKELILAFASSQVKHKDTFDDVISGKGKGIILLLSGGPGIGKTLTAESVAEDMKVPLYMMSAGDLGISSNEVESSLTQILEMVAKWNAVLLLDECDVFLEARSAHDLERNKIVSIFLRTLEYYEGILFLTTNRVKNMDPAFQSRIHISMEYPNLDAAARSQVWKNFLDRGVRHELGEEEIATLAKVEINGRQIKNILKTSQLLARHKDMPLRFEHLKTVLGVEGRL